MNLPIGPDVDYRLQAISDPSISPGGARVAYAFSWAEPTSLEARSRIMMQDFEGGLAD